MKTPTAADMKKGAIIQHPVYGDFTVTGCTTYDESTWWDVSSSRGATTVGENELHFYTLKP